MVNATRWSTSEAATLRTEKEVELVLSVAQAAELCGVSVDTIRRRLHSGGLPGAARDGTTANAAWLIPGSSLKRAGLCSSEILGAFQQSASEGAAPSAELAELTAELAKERVQREMAEQMLAQMRSEVDHLRRMVERLLPEMSPTSARRVS